MPLLHIANTDSELEMEDVASLPLEQGLKRNPIIHQLQFLPILYADKTDGLCVTDPPFPSFSTPAWHLLSEFHLPYDQVESWAPSQQVAQWAQNRHLLYEMPDWEVVKKVNSKAFSFQQIPPLPGAALIYNWNDLQAWLASTHGPRVLKSCFGVSGKGHLFLPASFKEIEKFTRREFSAGRAVIAEPWVSRKLDFSTQWMISKEKQITYVGSTVLQSDDQGRYHGNRVGNESILFGSYLPQLHAHKIVAQQVLQKMASLGFFGNVGIDAMIWGDDALHPIVEINARKTMGWISLQIAKRLFSNQTIAVSYVTASRPPSLLPEGYLRPSGEVQKFFRNLQVDALAN